MYTGLSPTRAQLVRDGEWTLNHACRAAPFFRRICHGTGTNLSPLDALPWVMAPIREQAKFSASSRWPAQAIRAFDGPRPGANEALGSRLPERARESQWRGLPQWRPIGRGS